MLGLALGRMAVLRCPRLFADISLEVPFRRAPLVMDILVLFGVYESQFRAAAQGFECPGGNGGVLSYRAGLDDDVDQALSVRLAPKSPQK